MAPIFHTYYLALRQQLERVPCLKKAIWIAAELKNLRGDRPEVIRNSMDSVFTAQVDPYRFARESEQDRFRVAEQMLREASQGRQFEKAWEIGCAEGMFTARLATCCCSLTAVDVSTIALARAKERCRSFNNINFLHWELQSPPPDYGYELIVAVGVLEYLRRRPVFRKVRETLVHALAPGGYLLIGTTVQQAIEGSWWARRLLRSSHINTYFGEHPRLRTVSSACQQFGLPFLHTLYQKTEFAADPEPKAYPTDELAQTKL